MLINHITNLYNVDSDISGKCLSCTHPTNNCSGSCSKCLEEIHWGPKQNGRLKYNCKRIIKCYTKCYINRYYQNIEHACEDIDLSKYSAFNILSIGCGASPDLMAFEKIAGGKNIIYNGIDENPNWSDLQEVTTKYASNSSSIRVNYEQRNIFDSVQTEPSNIYNVVILQFFISSVLSSGGNEKQIIDIFETIADKPLLRWKSSVLNTPFLLMLNDVDSMNKGRNIFFQLIDILEEKGYIGKAYAKSSHGIGDLGQERWSNRKNQQGYGNIAYEYSPRVCNNSACLVIEVAK